MLVSLRIFNRLMPDENKVCVTFLLPPGIKGLKTETFRDVFRTLSNTYNEVFLAEVVNVFQPLTIFAKNLYHSCST